MSDEPRAATTYLFADIEGSTQLWERVPAQMQAALAAHDGLARVAVETHRGHLVRTMGDGLYAVFDDPADALACALELQRALIDPAVTHGLALRVRCGLHLGDAERRDGDFFGPAVNRAARIMSIGHGGQTLMSHAVASAVAERLPPDVALLDLGRVRLRDLTSPERIWQLQHPGLRAQFPPLRSLEATPNNLAQQIDSFVGRERESGELRRLLAGARLLTLLGMGGIGKSRLAVQLAAELLDDYPDGVWLVELAPLTDPGLVPLAAASVVQVKEEPGSTVTDALLTYVRDKRVLFVLDNCEHVLHGCAALAKQLLRAGAGVKVLTTSRTALQVAGETVYAVPTLTVPDPGQAAAPDELLKLEAVRLFVDRATAAQASFRVTGENAAALVDICTRLDGIPLAIELAAARTRALSVQAIASRLDDRFRLLVTSDQTVPPRQRTLRALIDWSHDMLPPAERALFARLSVFSGGWTLEAAEAVSGLAGADAADVLAALVEKSLVLMDADGARYRMLDTVRHYAQEQLARGNDEAAARNHHLAHHLAFAEVARPELAGPDQGIWLARLDVERENFLSAHGWSERASNGDELGVRLMHALRPYWLRRGSPSVGLGLAREILARNGLQRRDRARCMALFGAGQMSLAVGNHAAAQRFLLECLSIARETDDLTVIARVLQPLGDVSRERRDFAAARAYLEEALALARQQDDRRELAAALTSLAMLHRMQARPELAQPLCESAVELARALGDHEVIGIGLLNLAMVSIDRGAHDPAQRMLQEVTQLADLTGSRPLSQSALEVGTGLAAALQCWTDAAAFFGHAEAERERAGLGRDPADDDFLKPLVSAARQALGPAFTEHEGRGREWSGGSGLVQLQAWLVGLGQRDAPHQL